MKIITFFICFITFFSCKEEKETLTAQVIIDKAINIACSGHCENAYIDFTFRDKCYVSTRKGNEYQLERITTDSTGITRDVLSNSGFQRFKNEILIAVPDSMAIKFSNSVNSVHYFAQLPFGLNAPSVQKELLGEDTINGENYYEIGVSFIQEGGGTDFDDTFVYWIHKEKFTLDYLAYRYVVDEGGIRFREAYNVRVVKGIRFVDYNNYKTDNLDIVLTDLDRLFTEGELKLLSKIETESVGVVLTGSK